MQPVNLFNPTTELEENISIVIQLRNILSVFSVFWVTSTKSKTLWGFKDTECRNCMPFGELTWIFLFSHTSAHQCCFSAGLDVQ